MNQEKEIALFASSKDRYEQEQLADILGYPTLRTVYDRENQIVLNVGDLITYKAVQRAKEAGVFEQLVKAVYRHNCQEETANK